jgi:hypothetical protein
MPAEDLTMFVIYERPSDYPTRYVVRKWIVTNAPDPIPADYFTLHNTLEEARATIPAWMVCIVRSPKDVPCIVESYV